MHNPINMSQGAVRYSKRDKHWAVPNVNLLEPEFYI